jgi:hypothetical protein
MSSFIVGIDKSGNVAAEAKDVTALVKIDSNGNTEAVSFRPKTKNPGQEVIQASGEAETIVMGLMQGPPNSKKQIVNVEPGTSVEKVVEKYKQGNLYTKEDKSETKTQYNVPKKDGSGQGTRANIGRNPECSPEDYKETGQGSGTLSGRLSEGRPQAKTYQVSQQSNTTNRDAPNTIDNMVLGDNIYNIGSIVADYSDAKTAEQKQIVAKTARQYLKEAHGKNLKGEAAVKYAVNKLKQNGYSKINSNSNKSKANAKKAA